jgi:hypothetical protein
MEKIRDNLLSSLCSRRYGTSQLTVTPMHADPNPAFTSVRSVLSVNLCFICFYLRQMATHADPDPHATILEAVLT